MFLPQFDTNAGVKSLVRVLVETRTHLETLRESTLGALDLLLHLATSCGRHGATIISEADGVPAIVKLMMHVEEQLVHERCCKLLVSLRLRHLRRLRRLRYLRYLVVATISTLPLTAPPFLFP